MHFLGAIVSLLEIRAHIPNKSFGSGPAVSSYGTPFVRVLAAFLITVAFLSMVLWLAVRLAIGLL